MGSSKYATFEKRRDRLHATDVVYTGKRAGRKKLSAKIIRGVFYIARPKYRAGDDDVVFSISERRSPSKEIFEVDPRDDEILDDNAIQRIRFLIDALDLWHFPKAKKTPYKVRMAACAAGLYRREQPDDEVSF